ncbi:DUF4238 domain-containing protein [Sphingomonas sp. OTU376]|uniref:DUF4238 domain-containing protein n=1 Tax=Sphingomonas sp. OTU376 TaxID=3043863 RepID=UPI00313B7A07
MTKKQNPPRRHHFIPQMMLRHFTNEKGQLWFWRRDFAKGDIRTNATQNLFVVNDLYTLVHPDGTEDIALETFFADMEGAGAKFIDDLAAIVRNGEKPDLDKGAWHFWDHFFYYHLKRAPGAIAAFAEQMDFDDKIAATVEKIRATRAETGRDPDEAGLHARVAKNAVIVAQAAAPSPEVLAQFEKMGLAIYRITDPARSFIVGDVPGAAAPFRLPGGRWSRKTLFIPLTSDIAVGQLARTRDVEIIEVDMEQVRLMNEATAARSTVIAGRSEPLLASLSHHIGYVGVQPLE